MKFTAFYKKFKPRLWQLTLIALFAIVAVLQNPITVHADANGTYIDTDGNLIVQGDGGGSVVTYTVPGPSLTGWLVYVVDVSGAQQSSLDWSRGTIVSDIVYVHAGRTIPTALVDNLYTRMGNFDRPVAFYTDCPWGAPFDTHNLSRQVEIEHFMETIREYNGYSIPQSALVVRQYLGSEVYQLYVEHPDTTYLILEACASHTILAGSKEGLNQIASGYGWALTQIITSAGRKDAGLSYFTEYGVAVGTSFGGNHADTSWCDNRELVKCCVLNERWKGIPYQVDEFTLVTDRCGRVSNITVSNTATTSNMGFGMLAYRLDNPAINTYNNIQSPGPAEDPITTNKSGLCTIVKGYITTNIVQGQDGRVVTSTTTSGGVYVTQNTSNIINVMAEPEYEIVRWDISKTLTTDLDPLNWSPPDIQRTGTQPAQQVLNTNSNEKVVYLLLEKTVTTLVEPESPDEITPTLTISESRLTKRTWLSDFGGIDWYNNDDRYIEAIIQDNDIIYSDTNILDVQIIWTYFSHILNPACPGHTWYHSSSTNCDNGSWGTCDCDYCGDCGSDHNGMGHDSSTTKDCLDTLRCYFFAHLFSTDTSECLSNTFQN